MMNHSSNSEVKWSFYPLIRVIITHEKCAENTLLTKYTR